MPPQQRQRLANVVGDCFDLGAHGHALGWRLMTVGRQIRENRPQFNGEPGNWPARPQYSPPVPPLLEAVGGAGGAMTAFGAVVPEVTVPGVTTAVSLPTPVNTCGSPS